MGSLKLLEAHSMRDRSIVIGASLFLLLAACLDPPKACCAHRFI